MGSGRIGDGAPVPTIPLSAGPPRHAAALCARRSPAQELQVGDGWLGRGFPTFPGGLQGPHIGSVPCRARMKEQIQEFLLEDDEEEPGTS